jgi:hypothetical protein
MAGQPGRHGRQKMAAGNPRSADHEDVGAELLSQAFE